MTLRYHNGQRWLGDAAHRPVALDTVLSSVDRRLGTGIIVDIDAIRYEVNARRELTIPRLDYDGNGQDAPRENPAATCRKTRR